MTVFFAVFFPPCPLEHHWKSNTEALFWREPVRVVQNTGSELKRLQLIHKSTQDQVVSNQIQPQTFSVALQMHEVAPEDIFQLNVVVHAQLPSASTNKLHCSDESAIIPVVS